MNKKIIDAMTDIVEEKMEQFKSDFYKFDLNTLKDYDGCFVWSVTQSHTHLELIDIFDIVEKLKKSETRRFTFMGSSSLSIGYAVNQDAECFKSDVYLYDGVSLKPISATSLNTLLTVIEARAKFVSCFLMKSNTGVNMFQYISTRLKPSVSSCRSQGVRRARNC